MTLMDQALLSVTKSLGEGDIFTISTLIAGSLSAGGQ